MFKYVAAAMLAVGLSAGWASAQYSYYRNPPFMADFDLGYSRLRIDGPNAKVLDKSDGAAFQVNGSTAIPGTRGWRFGLGLQGSDYFYDFHTTDTSGNTHHDYDQLTMLVPEFQLSYYLPIGHFFIQPKLGFGAAIADYQTGHIHHGYNYDTGDEDYYYHDDQDRVRINGEIHPALMVGWSYRHFAFGLEGAYLYTHLHFGDGLGGDVSELYAGAFARFQF